MVKTLGREFRRVRRTASTSNTDTQRAHDAHRRRSRPRTRESAREASRRSSPRRSDGKPVAITWTRRRRAATASRSATSCARRTGTGARRCAGTARRSASRIKGEQSWRIPALDEFAVTQAEAVEVNDQRQIQVQFSAALDTRQDLKGLVRLSQGEFTTEHQQQRAHALHEPGSCGEVTLTLEAALRSRAGSRSSASASSSSNSRTRSRRCASSASGVILPDAKTLSVPFEAVSARAVRVTALQVFETNIPQFLQVNQLVGHQRARPRGPRVVAQDDSARLAGARASGRATTSTSPSSPPNIRAALFQLTLSLTPKDALYDCPGGRAKSPRSTTPNSPTRKTATAIYPSNWDYYEEDYDYGGDASGTSATIPASRPTTACGQNIRASAQPARLEHRPDRQARRDAANCSPSRRRSIPRSRWPA